MRFIKLAVISILIFFLLFTSIGLLMPSSVTVARSENIYASIENVRFYTNDLNNWKYWLNGADTAYFKKITPNTSAINSKIKIGSYTITVINNNPKYITTLWQGENTKEQISNMQLYENSSQITSVKWSFEQQLSWYPWQRLGAMLHDRILGPSMEASLAKLKQLAEKN